MTPNLSCVWAGCLATWLLIISRKVEKKTSLPASGVLGMSGLQLPRIEVRTFDCNILNWRTFWEQFKSSVHAKTQLSYSDKLTYLRDAFMYIPARYVISGLKQTAQTYGEAIKCLQEHYDLHQAHIKLTTPHARIELTPAIPAIIALFFHLGSLSCWERLCLINEQAAPLSRNTLSWVELLSGPVIFARQVKSKTLLSHFCGGTYVTLIRVLVSAEKVLHLAFKGSTFTFRWYRKLRSCW